jgi:predicted porin
MQKKIIALAIAAAISAPAFADNNNFTFYGTVDVSTDFVNTGDGTATANSTAAAVPGTNKRVVSSNVSKFGFKGSEDLGDGLSAIWQIEQQVNIDNSSNSCAAVAAGAAVPACSANNGLFATRNTFGGLKSESLGTVLMGRHDTPYKISTRKLDVFADNIADNRALLGNKSNAGFELRPTDVLAYISPAFAGVTVAVATVNLSESNTAGSTAANGALSAAAMYDAAPFYGSVAYESHTLSSASTATILSPSESATRVGFGFKPAGFELNVVYEKTTDNLVVINGSQANLYGHTAYYVGGKVEVFGSDAVKLAYGNASDIGDATNTNSSANQVSVGYDHGLSKRTKVYALYTRIANSAGANYGFSQSTAGSSSVNGYGGTPTALSIGLKTSF